MDKFDYLDEYRNLLAKARADLSENEYIKLVRRISIYSHGELDVLEDYDTRSRELTEPKILIFNGRAGESND